MSQSEMLPCRFLREAGPNQQPAFVCGEIGESLRDHYGNPVRSGQCPWKDITNIICQETEVAKDILGVHPLRASNSITS